MKNSLVHENFGRDGFVILDDIISSQDIMDFQKSFFNILKRIVQEEKTKKVAPSRLIYDCENCNYLLKEIYSQHPNRITDIQRLASRLPEFFRISSGKALINTIKALMKKEDDLPLYPLSNVVVFEFPQILRTDNESQTSNFHTNWHDDTFWTIPQSKFIHIWIPLLNSVTSELGPLEVCPGSHKCGAQHQYEFHPDASYNYRYGINSDYVKQFKTQSLNVQLGQVLLFGKELIHRSGTNISDSLVRMTMLGLFHDASNVTCIPGTPSLKFRKKTPEQWYYERFDDKSIVPYLTEQLDEEAIPPTGI